MVKEPSSPLNALLQNRDGDQFQEIWAAITPQALRWNLQTSVCVQSPGGKHCWLVTWVIKTAASVWFSLTAQGFFRTPQKLEQRKQQGWLYIVNFHPQAPVPPTRLLHQHAKDAAELRIFMESNNFSSLFLNSLFRNVWPFSLWFQGVLRPQQVQWT